MRNPNSSRPETLRTTRSAKPALSPYFVEEIALTRSDILLARADDFLA
jgi:hypothetical protein